MEQLSTHIANRVPKIVKVESTKYAFEFHQRWTMVFDDEEATPASIAEGYELVQFYQAEPLLEHA